MQIDSPEVENIIDFILSLANISPWFYVGAILIGVVVGIINRNWKIGFLVGYMLIIFSIAVLSRRPGNHINNFVLFYKYRQGINDQILTNILFFIPIGMILGSIGLKWIWIGPVFSVLIEVSQLLLRRGMFDVDDIVSNCIGTIIGLIILLIIKTALGKHNKGGSAS